MSSVPPPPGGGYPPAGPPGGYPPPPPGGDPPPPPGGYPYGGPSGYAAGRNSKAVPALVLGILSLFCCGVVLGVIAIVLGVMARNEIKASGGMQTGDGLALAGIVLGALGVLSMFFWWGTGFYSNYL